MSNSSIQGPVISRVTTSASSFGMNDSVISLICVAACTMPIAVLMGLGMRGVGHSGKGLAVISVLGVAALLASVWGGQFLHGTKLEEFLTLNGTTIVDADVVAIEKPLSGKEHKGRLRTEGRFGFCGHNDPVEFRAIAIQRL